MTKTSLAIVAGIALMLTGCAGPPASPQEPALARVPGAYLGRAGDVFLAVVPGDNSVRVYACDGMELSNATVDQWFQGAFDGTGPVTLSAGAHQVTLRASDTGFAGEFLMGGKALPFVATLPTDGSALLDAEVRDPATGTITRDGNVIVLGGEQRGNMIPTRPPKCRVVLVGTGSSASYTLVCG